MGSANPLDGKLLLEAIELSKRCVPVKDAYCVGALIANERGEVIAAGFSRESGSREHAEEAALLKLAAADKQLAHTIYSSMEPCSVRLSGRKSCCELIIASGIRRVVYAAREPETFVICEGTAVLREAGLEVLELSEYAALVREINSSVTGTKAD